MKYNAGDHVKIKTIEEMSETESLRNKMHSTSVYGISRGYIERAACKDLIISRVEPGVGGGKFESYHLIDTESGKEIEYYWREDMLYPSFHCIDISVSDDIVSFLAMFETAGGKADDN